MTSACAIRVRGIVQGVGFRPFVFRLARENTLAGWVRNAGEGVDIHLEGPASHLEAFVRDLERTPPPAAVITGIEVRPVGAEGLSEFVIRESGRAEWPTVRIAPDLPVCEDCLRELFDSHDRRFGYPYINCTNCGPRYSVILALPYDRPNTTMRDWPLDAACAREYHDPADRRFHAQPVACPTCGPRYSLCVGSTAVQGSVASITRTAHMLRAGAIVAVKGIGGYHLACDARNAAAVTALRERKYRKEKPFALMVRDLDVARRLVELTDEGVQVLTSAARPILLARGREELPGVAPDTDELGLMLPYAPLHHLLFAEGTPDVLVMTSANRSDEPIAYEDEDALERLAGIADAFLIGERPIARRLDDSIVRVSVSGPMVLRRSRGYAPGVVAMLPCVRPILAVGADLKNTVTLVVSGQAIVGQHVGDLEHHQARRAFDRTIADLLAMYRVRCDDALVAHDAHPEYASTLRALELPSRNTIRVQHHRAHIASVLAERGTWDTRVLGLSLDGTGYGDDGTIWGGEIFAGSVASGFTRVGHLRPAALVGGDAAARHPVQAAAGFLTQVDGLPDLRAAPFAFGDRYWRASELVRAGVRTFATTSMGRLFDTAAALLGFTREATFEGQAAMWLEHLARGATVNDAHPFPIERDELDFQPLLLAVAEDRQRGRAREEIARAFHRGLAAGLCAFAVRSCDRFALDTVVLSGGVFQNQLLLADLTQRLEARRLRVWTNHAVPPNDGGISLGQAAMATFATL